MMRKGFASILVDEECLGRTRIEEYEESTMQPLSTRSQPAGTLSSFVEAFAPVPFKRRKCEIRAWILLHLQ